MAAVDPLVFLIHPCVYEALPAVTIRRDGLQLFLDREREVKARWLAELQRLPASALFVQLGGPPALSEAAAAALGAPRVLYLRTPYPASRDQDDYHRALTAELRAHLAAHRLDLDADRATAQLWGESFEGCVPGYGGAFAQHLGLARSPRLRFEMTVYDSRFLHLARDPETLAVGADVEAWLFACHDGTAAATFQPRRTAAWLDDRRVRLRLSDRRHQVCDKQGHTVWPAAPWTKGRTETEHDVAVPLRDWIHRWVRGVVTDVEGLRQVVAAAVLEAGPTP